VDDEEVEALRAEGLDPDAPAVVAALDLVRWELSLIYPVFAEFTGSSRISVEAEETYSELHELWCAVLGLNQSRLR
jgi:hypothetical protein